MTLAINDDFAKHELFASELDAISGGLHLTHGPNPPEPTECGGGHGPIWGGNPPTPSTTWGFLRDGSKPLWH